MANLERSSGDLPKKRGLVFETADQAEMAMTFVDTNADGPIEYDVVSLGENKGLALIMPNWMFEKISPKMAEQGVSFSVVNVKSMSEQPPDEQARRRGLRKQV